MYHLQIPRKDATSKRPGLDQEELYDEDKDIMIPKLYKAIETGEVHDFINVLKKVSTDEELPSIAGFVEVASTGGDSLLHIAAYLGREQIAEVIACRFPKLLISRNIRGDTALHVAARSENSDVIKVILSQYAIEKSKPEMKNEEITRIMNDSGDTALHLAVNSKHLGVITKLFDEDKDVTHYSNKSGKSPLYMAVETGNSKILDLLLQAPLPANEPLPQCHGNSPLHAAILERRPDLLQVILARRPELFSLRDEDGGTPLHYAACTGYVEGVRILLNSYPHSALQRNTKGHLPIHLACKRGYVQVVKLFLQEKWLNPRIFINKKGQNILHVAVKNGNINVVIYLMRNKNIGRFIINEKDGNGNTPLHLASKKLFITVLYIITQDKRTDKNLVNNEDLTARDIAWLASKSFRKSIALMILEDGVPLKAKYKDIQRPQHEHSSNTNSSSKDKINIYLIVATLIITVTFAAGFTAPGGVYSSDDPNPQNRGMAVLVDRPLFKVFTICNMVALYSSIISSIFLLMALHPDREFSRALIWNAIFLLFFAFLTLPIAFVAAIRLVVPSKSSLASVINVLGGILIYFVFGYLTTALFPTILGIPLLRQVIKFYLRLILMLVAGKQGILMKLMYRHTNEDK